MRTTGDHQTVSTTSREAPRAIRQSAAVRLISSSVAPERLLFAFQAGVQALRRRSPAPESSHGCAKAATAGRACQQRSSDTIHRRLNRLLNAVGYRAEEGPSGLH